MAKKATHDVRLDGSVTAAKPAPAQADAKADCSACAYWLGRCKARDLVVAGRCGSYRPKPKA